MFYWVEGLNKVFPLIEKHYKNYSTQRSGVRRVQLNDANYHEITKSQPQAAYGVFTHALTNRLTFLMRTVPGTDLLLQPLEEAIRHQFLPTLTGRQGISDL